MNDAVKSLRALWWVSLLVTLVWVSQWSDIREQRKRFEQALDLQAWLALNESLHSFLENARREVLNHAESSHRMKITMGDSTHLCLVASTEVEACYPLRIYSMWPSLATLEQSLEEQVGRVWTGSTWDNATHFVVKTPPHPLLPFDNYSAKITEGGEVSIRYAGEAMTPGIDMGRPVLPPLSWFALGPSLARHGLEGGYEHLRSDSPAVARLQHETDPRNRQNKITVVGLALSMETFFSGVGILLAGIALAMVGPLLALRRAGQGQQPDVSWVFIARTVAPPRSRFYGLLEAILRFVILLWAISPVVIVVLQSIALPAHEKLGFWLQSTSLLGTVCLVGVLVVHMQVAKCLNRFRRPRE